MGAENLTLASKPPELVLDIEKSVKGSKVIFNDATKNLYLTGIGDIKIEGNIITIYRSVQHARISVDYTSVTLDLHGTSTPQELVEYWQTNNFFFDLSGSVMGWDGKVEFHADLPIVVGTPPVGSIYYVEKATTILLGLYTTQQDGLWIRQTDTGALSDWKKSNNKVKYTTGEFALVDPIDQSKQKKDDVSAFGTSTILTMIWRNLAGTVSFLIEKFRDYTVGGANPAHAEGRVFYDFVKKALSYYNEVSDVTINIGQELVTRVHNDTGVTLPNGSAVRYGGVAVGGVPTAVLSQADTTANAVVTAVITNEILDGEVGYATFVGSVGGVDTSSFSIGDLLFLSATVPGTLTNVQQPITTIVAAVLSVDAVDGVIIVKPADVSTPFAVAQVFKAAGVVTQAITTTPVPVAAYSNVASPSVNLTTNFNAASGQFEANFQPLSTGLSGFYEALANFRCTYDDSKNVEFTVYINGVATELSAIMPFASLDPSEGAAVSFGGITAAIVTATDVVEIYVNSTESSGILTYETALFNGKRIGTA